MSTKRPWRLEELTTGGGWRVVATYTTEARAEAVRALYWREPTMRVVKHVEFEAES